MKELVEELMEALPGGGADGGPAWWRSRWRPCLVEEPMEALPGGGTNGGPAWLRISVVG